LFVSGVVMLQGMRTGDLDLERVAGLIQGLALSL